MGGLGWEILWGAPCCPKFASVELLWAFSKNRVAWEYTVNRTIPQVASDLYSAWYGGTGRRSGRPLTAFSALTAQKFITRTETEMNKWIDKYGSDVGLSGTISDLVVEDVGDAADGDLVGGESEPGDPGGDLAYEAEG